MPGFGAGVSRGTVCSLGQPNKAIGLESQIEPWLATASTLLAGAKKPHGTTQNSYGVGTFPMDAVPANHAPAESYAAADGGWMPGNFFLAREGKSVFS